MTESNEDVYRNLANDYKQQIASLESQLKEKDRIIYEYEQLLDPIFNWGNSPEAGLKLGESITKKALELAKSSQEKDREIAALRSVIKDDKRINESDLYHAQSNLEISNRLIEEKDKEIERLNGDNQELREVHREVNTENLKQINELRQSLRDASKAITTAQHLILALHKKLKYNL